MCRPTWLQPRWCLRMAEPRRIIVGISGASGAVYGVALLQALRAMPGVQTHLVVSDAGWLNIQHETALSREQVHQVQRGLARQQHQAAALFQDHVGGARQQVVRQAMGDGRQRAHGAGCHHHATGAKRAAGDAGTDVVDAVHHVGQGGCVRAL